MFCPIILSIINGTFSLNRLTSIELIIVFFLFQQWIISLSAMWTSRLRRSRKWCREVSTDRWCSFKFSTFYWKIRKKRVGIDRAPATYTCIRQVKDSLADFISATYGVSDMAFGQMTNQFISDYEHFLIDGQGKKVATAHKHLSQTAEAPRPSDCQWLSGMVEPPCIPGSWQGDIALQSVGGHRIWESKA